MEVALTAYRSPFWSVCKCVYLTLAQVIYSHLIPDRTPDRTKPQTGRLRLFLNGYAARRRGAFGAQRVLAAFQTLRVDALHTHSEKAIDWFADVYTGIGVYNIECINRTRMTRTLYPRHPRSINPYTDVKTVLISKRCRHVFAPGASRD